VTSYNDPRTLEARLVALERLFQDETRRSAPHPHMRDLSDAELWNAANGQVPVYDSASGSWKPGNAGGGGRIEAAYMDKFTEASAGVWTSDDVVNVTLTEMTRLRIGGTVIWGGHPDPLEIEAYVADSSSGVLFAASLDLVAFKQGDSGPNISFTQHPYTVEDLPAGDYSFYLLGIDPGDVGTRVVESGVLDVIVGQPMDTQILYSGVTP
jgi:hypothetical protein